LFENVVEWRDGRWWSLAAAAAKDDVVDEATNKKAKQKVERGCCRTMVVAVQLSLVLVGLESTLE
jgi:hypothetical protein